MERKIKYGANGAIYYEEVKTLETPVVEERQTLPRIARRCFSPEESLSRPTGSPSIKKLNIPESSKTNLLLDDKYKLTSFSKFSNGLNKSCFAKCTF